MSDNINNSSSACLLGSVSDCVWIIDFGATQHMTYNKSLLFDIKPLLILYLVNLSNGYKVKVTCTSSLNFLSFTLHNVLYLPSFHYNLIYVYKLISQLDCIVTFTKHSCLLHAPLMKRTVEVGSLVDGLYKLQTSCTSDVSISTCISSGSACDYLSSISIPAFVFANSDCSHVSPLHNVISTPCKNHSTSNKMEVLWHNRLGHIPFSKMKDIPYIPCNFSSKQSFGCSICPMARQSRLSFPISTIKTVSPFQLVHVDSWGPYSSAHTFSPLFMIKIEPLRPMSWGLRAMSSPY